LIGKVLHQWDINTNYQSLTFDEIIRRVQRADITNLLQEDSSILKEYVATVIRGQMESDQEKKQDVLSINDAERTSPAKIPEMP